MHFTSVFFYQIIKIITMKRKLLYFLPVLFMTLSVSCEDKKLHNEHKIDLFANEREEGTAYVMDEQECFNASDMVVSASDVKLADSSSGRGPSVFIYKIASGQVLKSNRDSVVVFPLQILSNQRLKLKKDSMYMYLKKLEGYPFIAKEKNLKYQWLKTAPVYSVKKEE